MQNVYYLLLSTATVVTLMRLKVTLYMHCLSSKTMCVPSKRRQIGSTLLGTISHQMTMFSVKAVRKSDQLLTFLRPQAMPVYYLSRNAILPT